MDTTNDNRKRLNYRFRIIIVIRTAFTYGRPQLLSSITIQKQKKNNNNCAEIIGTIAMIVVS